MSIISRAVIAGLFTIPVLGYTQGGKLGPSPKDAIVKKDDTFENLLKTKGAKGLVHGSVPETDMYVFAYGDPIRSTQYSLIPENDKVKAELTKIARNQIVTIYGDTVGKGTPQQHVIVKKIEAGELWNPKISDDPKIILEHTKEKRIPDLAKHLKERKEIDCSVHALLHGGKVLIVNYGGHTIPVHVKEGETQWTKDLWSTDKIRLRFKVRNHEQGPPHVSLRDEEGIAPVKSLESVITIQGKERNVKGSLVLFPKSPLLSIDIWGIQEKDPVSGLTRVYSLFNFNDEKDAQKIDETLRAAWYKQRKGFIQYSSSFYHPNIRLEINGTVNQLVRNQRNPILEIKSSDIKLLP